jgi:hypothetical protein
MSESETEGQTTRGPRGGKKHQPGRGHDRKSAPAKKKRYAEKAVQKRNAQEEKAKKEWREWDELSDELKKLLGPKKKPKVRMPRDES